MSFIESLFLNIPFNPTTNEEVIAVSEHVFEEWKKQIDEEMKGSTVYESFGDHRASESPNVITLTWERKTLHIKLMK